jgi:hypothetical protein
MRGEARGDLDKARGEATGRGAPSLFPVLSPFISTPLRGEGRNAIAGAHASHFGAHQYFSDYT